MGTLTIQLQPFFEWLLRTTLQASLLICLILLFQVVLRSRLGARWHYCLWLLLLIRMVMPWAPQSRLSVFNFIPKLLPQRQTEYARAEVSDETLGSNVAEKNTDESKPVSKTGARSETAESVTVTPVMHEGTGSRLKPAFLEVADVLPLIWLAGALVLAVYVCAGNYHLWWLVKRERPLTDHKILDLLEDCKAEMGIRIILGIVATDKVKSPALFGFIRPRLLLPAGMLDALNPKELRHVFLHELAHLKRHDIYIGWLMSLLQVLHWFNPLIWLAFYRLRADRELACDALVLARTQSGQAKDYGRTIVYLLERFSQPRRLPSMAGILETKAQLKRRITMIAGFKKNSYQWSALAIVLIIILGCVSLPNARRTKAADTTNSKPVPQLVLRRVNPDPGGRASISPDGKYLCGGDSDTAHLIVGEIATGKIRHLPNNGSSKNLRGVTFDSAISPDSKSIAYLRYSDKEKAYGLHVIGFDGSGHRVLRRDDLDIDPRGWSPDAKQILATQGADIIWVSAVDGSVQRVTTVTKDWPRNVDLSPDGHYIAYDVRQEKGSQKRDILVFAVGEKREIPFVEHSANDRLLGWTPDGKHILFASDRTGSWDGWLLQVVDGRPYGLPELVKPLIGDVKPIGVTQSGSFYYTLSQQAEDVYVAELNLKTGKVLASPRLIRHSGSEGCPDWSPDGQYLAYCTWRPDGLSNIHIHSVRTGQERVIDPNLSRFRAIRWFPDGRFLLVLSSAQGVYNIDVETGERTALFHREGPRPPIWMLDLSPDGKVLSYTRARSLAITNFETGSEKRLFELSSPPYGPGMGVLAFSPDGQSLAFVFRERKLNERFSWLLNVVPAAGGEPRELLRRGEYISAVAWTPDSKDVLCAVGVKPDTKLWRIPAEGGDAQELWQWDKRTGIRDLRVHPDGRHIAFVSSTIKSGLWVMENFLPVDVASPAGK